MERAEKFEEEVRRISEVAERFEEQVKHYLLFFFVLTKSLCQIRNIQKKMQITEGSFDHCSEQLFEVTLKLEEKEKAYGNAEG